LASKKRIGEKYRKILKLAEPISTAAGENKYQVVET
jgi:hypothetical protein